MFVFPDLLVAFAVLLGFNLLYQVALRRRGETWYVPMISMAVNAVLISLVLHYSGGPDSDFWPMYLLPIFTACLYLETRHVIFAFTAASAFLLCFYIEPLSEAPAWHATELAIKMAVLALSASVTARYAFQERRSHRDLASARGELERLASAIERAEGERVEHGGGVSRFLAGLVYDLNGRLTLIRGRADLLTQTLAPDSPQAQDARLISDSVRSLSRLGSDLLRVLRREEDEKLTCDAVELIEQVLTLIEPQLRPLRLKLTRSFGPGLPKIAVSGPYLQQAMLELLEAAIETSRISGTISVATVREHDDVLVRVRFEAPEGSVAPSAAAQKRLLEPFRADVRAVGSGGECEYVLILPAASAVARERKARSQPGA
jgi:signal transduction histidine kinase